MARNAAAVESRSARLLGYASAILTAAVLVLYVLVIATEDHNDTGRVVLVAASFVVLSVLAVLGAVERDPTRRLAFFAATGGGLLMWGVLALFSVGLLLLAAAVPAWGAAAVVLRTRQAMLLPAVIAGAVAFMLPPILLSAL